jgi:hypothetical protein
VPETNLTDDHKQLDDDQAARRYFAKFSEITRLMGSVVGEMEGERSLPKPEAAILRGYAEAIAASFRALSLKYLIAGRLEGMAQKHLTIDFHESGFPVFQEIVTMVNDAAEAARHLQGLPDMQSLKDEMVRQIVGERTVPVKLQYALSQRLYYEALAKGGLYLAQMHPRAEWSGVAGEGRRRYLIHWGVYDSQMNVPIVYLMELEDSGRRPLHQDGSRWPEVQAHLLAQSTGGLKLLTIATGFDKDFADLHPKRLKRVYLGPMYSSAFTLQTGPIKDVLDGAKAGPGDDWALAWTIEELESERVETDTGWFTVQQREVFRLDPLDPGADTGATRTTRNLVLPQLPFQVLSELDPPGFRKVRKYVVGREGRVAVYA